MAVKLTKKELNALLRALERMGVTWTAVYLFGSTAKGFATRESDRDFCVIVPDKTPDTADLAAKLTGSLGLAGFNFDIIVTTTTEFRSNKISPILHEIRQTGIKVA